MSALPRAHSVAAPGHWSDAADRIALDFAARFLRRKKLVADGGLAFLVDLPQTTDVPSGAAFLLEDGRAVAVEAAVEPLLRITGPDLTRIAWHIGNRHTPCQIETDHLLIGRDPVLRDMLGHLGASVAEVDAPFMPEGGAYGVGRTHGHAHDHTHDGRAAQSHDHG